MEIKGCIRCIGAQTLEPDCMGLNPIFIIFELCDPGQVIHLLWASVSHV